MSNDISWGAPPPNCTFGRPTPADCLAFQVLVLLTVYSLGLNRQFSGVGSPSISSCADCTLSISAIGGSALGDVEAGVADFDPPGRDVVGLRVQRRPLPLQRERAVEHPGLDRRGVGGDQRDRQVWPLGGIL